MNAEQLSHFLRTNKSRSFARYLVKKYKSRINLINRRQRVILKVVTRVCIRYKNTKKPNRTTSGILNYFLNKFKVFKQQPASLLIMCERFLTTHSKVKIIPSLSSLCGCALNMILVLIEESENDFKGLEPVCYYTEVFEENNAWFRKNILREKYRKRKLLYKKRTKRVGVRK